MAQPACLVTVMRACAVWHVMPLHSQLSRALGGGQASLRGRRQGAGDADGQSKRACGVFAAHVMRAACAHS